MVDLGGGCVHGAERHLDVRMVRWDGGVERQCGWSCGQVERWICRRVKVDRQGRRPCESEGQAQGSVDLSVRLG